MSKKFVGCLAATALAMGFATAANAIPIYFDFTGTVTSTGFEDAALIGTSISGGFSFETDNMYVLDSTDPVRQLSWYQFDPAGDPLGYLNFGGEMLSWTANPYDRYGGVTFLDACTSEGCFPGWGENLSWNVYNYNFVPDANGIVTTTIFSVMSANTVRYTDYPYVEYLDYFDGNEVSPLSAATLPLYELTGIFAEQTYDCASGECQYLASRSLNFSIDDVTRGAGARAVPEPGTLSLFALGLGGLAFMRRRKAGQTSTPGIAG